MPVNTTEKITESYRTTSRVSSLQILMVGTKLVPKKVDFKEMARMTAREDFVNVGHLKASDHAVERRPFSKTNLIQIQIHLHSRLTKMIQSLG
jgi:hypothetical protein